jgi:periplasmic protein TonB
MGYQALLFSPDEKLARVVSQVFTELDFTVEPAHEPFGAVKKLMAQRYDAIVVDCDNEQNASLLFKSARNSSFNQSSLAIALVEGQAGVAKAYRIGANLVLTKPINVEQAKGTLRVARGLLRKNSDAAGGVASGAGPAMPPRTAPGPAVSSSQPASRGAAAIAPPPSRPGLPEFEAPLPTTIPEALPHGLPTMSASPAQNRITMGAAPAVPARPAVAASALAQNTSSAFTSPGSAAAPAPAKKVTVPPAKENETVQSEPANRSHDGAPMLSSLSVAAPPSFSSLGEEQDSGGSGGNKKIIIAAVITVVLAALGYLSYGNLGKSSTSTPAPQTVSTPQDSGNQDSGKQDSEQPAPALAPMSSPKPSASTPNRASSATQTSVPKTATATLPDMPSPGAGNPPVIRIPLEPGLGTKKPDSTPLLVKSNPAGTKTQAQSQESAPPLPSPLAVASAAATSNDSALSGLLSSASSSLSKPSLATTRVSQGVSQGLLIKRVQPRYPQAALVVHAQGAVQIEATINKEGIVTNLKVLSGDPILAHAALEAVRQWRYKPYYLDGEPIEIQTDITVNFKAN